MATFDEPYQTHFQPYTYQADFPDQYNTCLTGGWISIDPALVSTTNGEILGNGYTDWFSVDRRTHSSDMVYEGSDSPFELFDSCATTDSMDFNSACFERSSPDLNDFAATPTALSCPHRENSRKQPAASLCERQRSNRIHSAKDMTCEYCSKKFTRARDRDRHVADIHTQEGDYYACASCDYGSTRKDKVMSHCKRMHKDHSGYLIVDGLSHAKKRGLGNPTEGAAVFVPSDCAACNPGQNIDCFDFY